MATSRPTERQARMLRLQDIAERQGGEIPRVGDDAEICVQHGWLDHFGVGEYVLTDAGRRIVNAGRNTRH